VEAPMRGGLDGYEAGYMSLASKWRSAAGESVCWWKAGDDESYGYDA
jgi:hypothetical protein